MHFYNPITFHSQSIISKSVSCLGSISAGSFPEQPLVIEHMSCYATPIGTPKKKLETIAFQLSDWLFFPCMAWYLNRLRTAVN